jgi:alpha-tubulin suppressor-like RCC1 family protein
MDRSMLSSRETGFEIAARAERARAILVFALALTAAACGLERGESMESSGERVAVAGQALGTAGEVCLTVQQDNGGAVQDATIWQSSPGWNDGAASRIYTGTSTGGGPQKKALLRFDLSGVPAGVTLTQATFSIFQLFRTTSATVSAYRITAPWSAGSVTWNNFNNAVDPAAVGSFAVLANSTGAFRSVDVLALAQGWVSGAVPNHGILLDESSGAYSEFRSSQAPTVSERPKLKACYVTCSDGIQNGNETGVDCGGSCASCLTAGALTAGAGSMGDCNGNPARCVGVSLAAGSYHTVTLNSNGTVWAWGWNGLGQIGDGTTTPRTTPVQVSLTGITAVAGGGSNTVALKSDGTLWTWGNNTSGQIGDGTTTNRTTPVQVAGLTGVTAATVGQTHIVALKSDGTVWTWGSNASGQLGDGTTTPRTTPMQVADLTGVTAVAAGGFHTVALKSDGTVWTSGNNAYGQLGIGTTTWQATPVQVTGLAGVTAIAAGAFYTVALKADGTVWAFGDNASGQLGDGTTTNRTTPVQVIGLANVTAVAAGWYHTVALKSDGAVWTFGDNASGQLGDGTTTHRTTPVQVTDLANTQAVAAGALHTVALAPNGTARAWGGNNWGGLGDGTMIPRTMPVSASGLRLFTPCASSLPTCSASGACTTAPLANGSACDDDDYCTQQDTCNSGACSGTAASPCAFPSGAILVAHAESAGTSGPHSISVIDPLGNTLKKFGTIAADIHRAHLALAGGYLFRANGPDVYTLHRFDGAGNVIPTATPTTSSTPWIAPIATDQSGASIVFVDNLAGTNVLRHLDDASTGASNMLRIISTNGVAGLADLFTGGPSQHTYALVQVSPVIAPAYRVAELYANGTVSAWYDDASFTVPYGFDIGSVAVDAAGTVYVATTTHIVSVNAAGQPVGAFALSDPKPSVAIDAAGKFYIGHYGHLGNRNGHISVHAADGTLLRDIYVSGAERIIDVLVVP